MRDIDVGSGALAIARRDHTMPDPTGRAALSLVMDVLCLLEQPAIALDRSGFVVAANASAEQVFDDEIRLCNRRLFVRDQGARFALDQYIDRLRATPDRAPLPAVLIVARRRAKRPLLIRIQRIEDAAHGPFAGARALLVLSDLSRTRATPADALGAAFDLSPAETKLAGIIASGHSLDEAAEQLSVARQTARNQLKAVFAKTTTHRQSELVALLSRI